MLQVDALDILKTGANIFLTGVPGAGKTYVINQYINYLEEHGVYPSITASTGIAATHIGGSTIHSWSGIGVEKEINDWKLDSILQKEKTVKRIKDTKVLIIDEISMLDARTLDNVDKVCRAIKNPEKAFGGIQVVFVGDFFQLPPIVKRGEVKNFAFASNAWKESKPLTCYLEEQYRQTDETFTNLLLAIRGNVVDEAHIDLLKELVRKTNEKLGIKGGVNLGGDESFQEPSVEYGSELSESEWSVEEGVDEDNGESGLSLGDFGKNKNTDDNEATDRVGEEVFNESVYENLDADLLDTIELHSHNKNVDLINELRLRAIPNPLFVFDMTNSGSKRLVENLIKSCLSPEILKLKVGAKVIFTKNDVEGKYVNGTVGEVTDLAHQYIKVQTQKGRVIEVKQVDWAYEEDGKVKARITQYPLRLAWAITVHKSQGMSLDTAILNLGDTFEYGQGYVALSRVRDLEGLYLKSFNAKSLKVHEAISEFDEKILRESKFIEEKFKKAEEGKIKKLQEDFIAKCGGLKDGGAVKKDKSIKKDTLVVTLEMIEEGKNLDEIVNARGLSFGTIVGHLEELKEMNKINSNVVGSIVDNKYKNMPMKVIMAFMKFQNDPEKSGKLTPVFEELKQKVPYDELRIYRLLL